MAALYNEIEKYPAEWLRNLITAGLVADGEVEEESVETLAVGRVRPFAQFHAFAGIGAWSHALRLAGVPDSANVWTGSCPCQGFSVAGKKKGFDDPRHLWPSWFRLIRECRPALVLGEQSAAKGALPWLDLVSSDLEREGYTVRAVDLCAPWVGAPHLRQRLYFAAVIVGHPDLDERDGALGRAAVEARRRRDGAERPQRRGAEEPARAGAPDLDRLADTGRERCEPGRRPGDLAGEAGGPQEEARQRERRRHAPGRRGPVGGVADAGGERRQQVRRGPPGDEDADGREGRHRVGEDGDHVAPGHGQDRRPRRLPAFDGQPVFGYWDDCEWAPCLDPAKGLVYRPAQPGVEPLADGAAFGVDAGGPLAGKDRKKMIKAYGNAIVAPMAAEFIRAVLESL